MPEAVKRRLPITIGADPEFFLREKATGKFISAHDKLPGTKSKPFKCEGGAMQVDGVAAEFNIIPASDPNAFTVYCSTVISQIRNKIPPELEFVYEPTCEFSQEEWDRIPPESKELGCDPDFNAWTGTYNPPPDGANTRMRTASGHVHLGWAKGKDVWSPDHVSDCELLVRQLDYYLGCASLIWDGNTKRRSLYGKAGAHRRKSYGVEYRVLSNKWLTSPGLQQWVFVTAQKCLGDLLSGRPVLTEEHGNLAEEVINNNVQWWDDPKHKLWEIYKSAGLNLGVPLACTDTVYKKPESTKSVREINKEKTKTKFKYTGLDTSDTAWNA